MYGIWTSWKNNVLIKIISPLLLYQIHLLLIKYCTCISRHISMIIFGMKKEFFKPSFSAEKLKFLTLFLVFRCHHFKKINYRHFWGPNPLIFGKCPGLLYKVVNSGILAYLALRFIGISKKERAPKFLKILAVIQLCFNLIEQWAIYQLFYFSRSCVKPTDLLGGWIVII